MRKLNFCCGKDIKEGWDNCDIQKDKKIIYCDANKFPYPFKKDTYSYILIKQTLHMLNHPEKVLEEFWKVSKENAIIEIEVPYYNNKGASTDILTKHYFSDATFHELINQTSSIKKKNKFRITEIKFSKTKVGKIFPLFIIKKLSLFLGGLISTINIKLKVIKNEAN